MYKLWVLHIILLSCGIFHCVFGDVVQTFNVVGEHTFQVPQYVEQVLCSGKKNNKKTLGLQFCFFIIVNCAGKRSSRWHWFL